MSNLFSKRIFVERVEGIFKLWILLFVLFESVVTNDKTHLVLSYSFVKTANVLWNVKFPTKHLVFKFLFWSSFYSWTLFWSKIIVALQTEAELIRIKAEEAAEEANKIKMAMEANNAERRRK